MGGVLSFRLRGGWIDICGISIAVSLYLSYQKMVHVGKVHCTSVNCILYVTYILYVICSALCDYVIVGIAHLQYLK